MERLDCSCSDRTVCSISNAWLGRAG